jgi:TRAP-type mannitol/chloroaromatic compound transport system permease large subunit
MSETDAVAITGFVVLFGLMLLRVPVGMAMGLVGVSGFSYLVGGAPALKLVGQTSMRTVTDYTFGVIPMFLLMGALVSTSGMSRELFRAANTFVGHCAAGSASPPLRHAAALRQSLARRSQPPRPSPRWPIRRCGGSAIRRALPPA